MSISGISGTDSYYYLSQLTRQSSSSSSSSLSDLFSSIGGSGDGSISQSELTTYLENQDGSLANSVMGSQTDTGSLVALLQDASQLDSATGTTTAADQLFNAIDTSGSGSISKSEFEAYVSNLASQSGSGTSASDATSSTSSSDTTAADQLFNAIDTSGSGSISKSEFEAYVSNLASQSGSGTSAMSAPPPPPPPDSSSLTSSLDTLLQSLGITTDSSTSSTAASAATSSSSTSSTSSTADQTNSATAFMAVLMEAIGKYMQFGGQNATSTSGAVSVTG